MVEAGVAGIPQRRALRGPVMTTDQATDQRRALRAERDAIERRQYADLLRLREIRAELDELDAEWLAA